jgi:myo-inositol-1(or 4)-monophosphatase
VIDELTNLTTIAERAVGLGYDIIKNTSPADIRLKGDRDVVTDIDLTIENEVREFLKRMTPDKGFLGEEDPTTATLDGDQDVWTLDPVDGTANLTHGLPLCAVSLALVRRGEPIVAAVIAPFLDLRYIAAKDRGAFGNGVRLRASKATNLSESIVSIGDYAVGDQAGAKNLRRLRLTTLLAERVERVRMFGSAALDLAWVAEGRTDATIILANKPWDTAAGVLLAREAGALVLDATGAPHDFTSSETIATSPGIADLVLSLLKASRRDTS